MARGRFKTGLAVVGGCAALSVVAPPLAGLLNAVGSLTLLALAAYAAYRSWAFLEAVVEASRRPVTVRRNLHDGPERPAPGRAPSRSRTPPVERAPQERAFRIRPDPGHRSGALAEPFRSR
ncbi:MAG: hypothetical protein ACYDHB_02580 [Candidatus Dormibacteria bacterium]